MSNRKRTQTFQSLIQETRRFIANAVLFNQRLADNLGVNATDYQVLNLLDLRGQATPGELGRLTGLSTGGVTLAIDRLESAGFVKRERNTRDRRSLTVRPVPKRMRKVSALYKPIIAAMQKGLSVYDDRQIATILDFFTRSNASRRGADPLQSESIP